ncbi:hypothetical protein BDV27DRAFT_152713 [Aspergillus caelatus]|uniref:Uncharacterized protein n=1 Tax=Aspergillus caelatus TaxID=61420 RepID=A0A5N7AIW7_9EURO|nr:uncharacterized protein BDV27DRAFT_152713 [Aspergillus caelatus]KAE8369834.1 hypothetical protein BDV27DRAFT_152713 [Aspergillus caelatus]
MRVINAITDEPGWDRQVFDKAITAKWRSEIIDTDKGITPNMIDWIIDEVKWKAENYSTTGFVVVFDPGVVKSDTAISEELQNALKDGVRTLEDSLTEKDYHPGSDDRIVDLVHPSLFPVVFGRTRAISDSLIKLESCLDTVGQETVFLVPAEDDLTSDSFKNYSWEFQWLPCDVDLLDNGSCAIVSYINNLHPQQNAHLYHIIEKIIAQALPLWNTTLTYMNHDYWRIPYNRVEYEACDSDKQESDFGEESSDNESVDRLKIGLHDFRSTGLQIIVKLANIELTPEKPEYPGGSWHVKGQLNEHICATSIYCYDSENITENTLSFRQRVITNMYWLNCGEEHDQMLQKVFGFPESAFGTETMNLTQELGSLVTKEGRLFTFPNILQHRVSPFSLADCSRPGHRKILALFLVDPHLQIISSSHVPPQQEDWDIERIMSIQQALRPLPQKLQDMLYDNLNTRYVTMDEARPFRLELMEERSSAALEQNENFEYGRLTFFV